MKQEHHTIDFLKMSDFEISFVIIGCIIIGIPLCIIIFILCYGTVSKFVQEDDKDKSRINPVVLIIAIILFIGVIYVLFNQGIGESIGVFRP